MTEPNQLSPTPPVDPGPGVDPASGGDPPATPVDPPPHVDPPPVDPPPAAPPASDWREPPWFPPRDRDRRERRANIVAIVLGLVILAVGVYYFLDRTLGLAMPSIQWGSLWPVILIVLGGLILLRSIERR